MIVESGACIMRLLLKPIKPGRFAQCEGYWGNALSLTYGHATNIVFC